MAENHKITAQPRPTTESQRFRDKNDIVRMYKEIALPTNLFIRPERPNQSEEMQACDDRDDGKEEALSVVAP
jgi:hypothetical protein